MTTIFENEEKCSVCGKASSHTMLGSSNQMGYPDLDLRPSEMYRSTMHTWVMECPHCGYVAPVISNETQITKEFIESEKYQTCNGFQFADNLARRFYKQYLINLEEKDLNGAFSSLHHCCWVCDDLNDRENSDRLRNILIDMTDELIAENSENRDDILVLKTDFLRRSGQFDRLITEFEDIHFDEEIHEKIVQFQIEKAKLNDDKCYTIEALNTD